MSNLSAFPLIQERSEATPGLWNMVFSTLSSNIAAVDATVGLGRFQQLSVGSTPPSYATTAAVTIEVNSNQSDYLYLVDSAAQRSSYIIGSRAGNTADGLNIWDVSAATMIVSFSKQSIRFYQNVVGPVFDVGGALADTLNAATFGTGADSKESRIQAAISAASIANVARVYVPANMYPYSAASVSFDTRVQMVREGGDWTVYDIRAYGADHTGVKVSTSAISAAAAGVVGVGGGVLSFPNGTYSVDQKISIVPANSGHNLGRLSVVGAGTGATNIRPTVVPWLEIGSAAFGTANLVLRDFTVQLTSNLYWGAGTVRFIRCVQIHCQRIALLSGTDLLSDLYNYTGYLFEFDTSYIFHLDRCDAYGRGVYLFDVHSESVPTEQMDTCLISNCQTTGMALSLIKSAGAGTDFHNFTFHVPKHLMVSGWAEANVSFESTLTSSPIVGATTFTVTSASGMAAGTFMWVGQDATIELVKIASVGGLTITTSNPLRYAHTSGDLTLVGGFLGYTGTRIRNVRYTQPHCEFSATVALVWKTTGVVVEEAYGTVRDVIRVTGGPVTDIKAIRGEVAGNGGVNNVLHVTTGGDNAGSGPFSLEGPFINPNTGNPPTNHYLNDAGTTRAYRFTNILASGTLTDIRVDPTVASGTLLESIAIGGATRYERDLAGSHYALRYTNNRRDLTDAATVAVDASLSDDFRLLAGASRTIGAPSNKPAAGRTQRIAFTIYNNTAGVITTTWTGGAAGYLLAGTWVDPAPNKRRSVIFNYDSGTDNWIEIARTSQDV